MAKTKYIHLIKQIIDPKYISINQSKLEELNNGIPIQTIDINAKINEIDYLLCRFHEEGGNNLFPFFADRVGGLCKMADYILFIEKKEKLYVISIELKLGNKSSKMQLDASTCFAFFLVNTLNRLYTLDIEQIKPKTLRISQNAIKADNRKKEKEKLLPLKKKGQLRTNEVKFDKFGHLNYTRRSVYINELIDAHYNE